MGNSPMDPNDIESDNPLDRLVERLSVALDERITRKAVLVRLGTGLLGILGLGAALAGSAKVVDASSCSDWQYCGLHGNLCSPCTGGTDTSWPAGCSAQASWTYCCQLPGTSCWYYETYKDCCGQNCSPSCSTFCNNSSQGSWCTSGSYGCTMTIYGGLCSGSGCPFLPAA